MSSKKPKNRRVFVIVDRGQLVHHTDKRSDAIAFLRGWDRSTAFIMRARIDVSPNLLPKVG